MATQQEDYYQVLGLERDATSEEIRKAYRKLAIKHHPDRNNGDEEATARFKQVNQAYEVLSDPEKKARYDRFGPAGVDGNVGADANFEDLGGFAQFFVDVFGGFGGAQARGGARGQERGGDRRVDVEITLEEVLSGTEKAVPVTRLAHCGDCSGSGARPGTRAERCVACAGQGYTRTTRQTLLGTVTQQSECYRCHGAGEVIKDPCPRCSGRGQVRETVTLQVTIPPGVDERVWIPRPGEGDAGRHGGPSGDLGIFIKVKPHPVFQRQGRDLHNTVEVSFVRAALGGQVQIPTLEGVEQCEIPSGTQPGERFTIPNKGLPDHRRPQSRGDQHVTVKVRTPTHLNDRQRELLREFAASSGEDLTAPESEHHGGGGFLKWVRNLFHGKDDHPHE